MIIYSWGPNNYTRNLEDEDAHRIKKDKTDKWNYDKYNDEEQASKSCAEVIEEYGYNIREREGSSRAH